VPGATMSGSGAARVGATGLVRVGGVRIVIDAGGSLLSADDTKGPPASSPVTNRDLRLVRLVPIREVPAGPDHPKMAISRGDPVA
jgi:hypothetical protein